MDAYVHLSRGNQRCRVEGQRDACRRHARWRSGAVPKPTLANGVPTIFTSQDPRNSSSSMGRRISCRSSVPRCCGHPTRPATLLVDTASKDYFPLLSGRWFRAAALDGQWTFVASNALPPDFARIPPTSLAGAVLQAVAGTPQAQQALNENSIAQTASVPLRNGPKFTPKFDGAPQYASIPGTTVSYVTNASAPVIRISSDAFYAVRAGVWFTAAQATGPWTIATKIPDAIYTIPPSSPIYYITYVRIYEVTADVVREGYTPGYLGTAVVAVGHRRVRHRLHHIRRGSTTCGIRRPSLTALPRRQSTTRTPVSLTRSRSVSPRRRGPGRTCVPSTTIRVIGAAIRAARRLPPMSIAAGAAIRT